jgi:ubiquinone biosynthesis protein
MSRHLDRYREIAETLSRHGMGYLVGILGLDRLMPFHHGLLGHERRAEPYTRPEHLRLALEQLGATFVKLGQILSTRPDLLGPEYQAELVKLQDAAPPVPGDEIVDAVASELGRPVDELFATFELEPLAAASIGQAHAATLHDGREVVVKVRRPGIVEQVEEDTEILQNLAVRASHRWEAAAGYDIVGLADEFAQTLRAELDYLREARNGERFAANFAHDPEIHIPHIFWDTTTSRVLTLERIRGINVSDIEALDAAGIDRRALAERATRVVAQMVFEDGFFHADPHPGNFFIEAGGRIGIIDFGMVGEVDDGLREGLGALLLGLTRQDPGRMTDAVLKLTAGDGSIDRQRVQEDLARLMARYQGRAIGDLPIGALIEEVLGILRRHRLQVPRELALLLKAIVMNEGIGAGLDPGFALGRVLAPYAQRFMARELSPAAVARRLGHAALEAAEVGIELPEQLRSLLAAIDSRGLEVHLRADDLELLVARARRLDNRLVAATVAAALIEGLADLLIADPGLRRSWRRPAFALGVAATGSLGAYLAWTARRRPGGQAAEA